MRRHLTVIVEYSEQLLRVVDGRGTSEPPRGKEYVAASDRPPESVVDEGPMRKTGTMAHVRGKLDAAQYFVEKTARDVSRFPPGVRPTPQRASQILVQLRSLIGRSRARLVVLKSTRR